METREKDTVLLVDDEQGVLASLRRLLKGWGYAVVTATCGDEALRILEMEEIHLIIADHRMPGMSGVELMKQVRRRYPDTVRILLTGQADIPDLMAAVNEGEIYRFFSKPWNDQELCVAVAQALAHRAVLLENRRLLETVRRQQAHLEALERQYPGITRVEKDAQGCILLNP